MPRWFGYIPMNTNIEDGETVRLNPDDGHTFESHKYTDNEDLGAAALSNSYDDLDDLPTLGSAAEEDSSAFATATQGAKADSAVQPGDLAEVAYSGSYNDLEDRPTIPAAFSQVNADWNATSGAGQIFNKPTIPTLPVFSQAIASRSLNSNFVVSSTRNAFVSYSVEISATLSLSGGQSGSVFLEISPNGSTGWIELARSHNANTGALTIGLNITQSGTTSLSGTAPAGWTVRLRSTGSAIVTYRTGQESLI